MISKLKYRINMIFSRTTRLMIRILKSLASEWELVFFVVCLLMLLV